MLALALDFVLPVLEEEAHGGRERDRGGWWDTSVGQRSCLGLQVLDTVLRNACFVPSAQQDV